MKNIANSGFVIILGLGESGYSMAKYFCELGTKVIAFDTRDNPPLLEEFKKNCAGAIFQTALFNKELLSRALKYFKLKENNFKDNQENIIICKSPGIAPHEIKEISEHAKNAGIKIIGELQVFSSALQELKEKQNYAPKILAITGTNGKTTTTMLTCALLNSAGISAKVAGNVGPALMSTLINSLNENDLPAAWVLELSSFQLNGVNQENEDFNPDAAAILNITQDHISWHGNFENYAGDKLNIFGKNTICVLPEELTNDLSEKINPPAKNQKSTKKTSNQNIVKPIITISFNPPKKAGDLAVYPFNSINWLIKAASMSGEEIKQKRGKPHEEDELYYQRLMPADALKIRGLHNASNALFALALASSAGANLAQMLYQLREYKGEPHRVESVGVLEDVEYIDDSKGTNVGATIAAINGLSNNTENKKIILILGGDGKGQDFSPLEKPILGNVKAVILIGRDANIIEKALEKSKDIISHAKDMNQAVLIAASKAKTGDTVLLSPACASLDMYKDYKHRALAFCEAIKEMAEQKGITWNM